MRLYLGTHEPTWIGRSPQPLFVSLERSGRFGRRPARAGWALDSGGYTRLHKGGWTTTPAQYLDAVYALADRCPGLEWCAPQDWMCEPTALAATGLTVAEHQRRTVDNYAALHELDDRRLVIPVLQGWAPGDHEQCLDLYTAAGFDLTAADRVGVGTICRRQNTTEIARIIRTLAAEGLNLHGFGVKAGGLVRYGHLLASADSLAWSYRGAMAARHGEGRLCAGGSHASCANCYEWAHTWHARVLEQHHAARRHPEQLELPV